MYVSDLIIEVTRKCNLKCEHCLRGCAQRKTMSSQTLWNALKDIDDIGSVSFTGGEPSLAPEVIEEFNYIVRSRGINIEWFYCVTNGMPHNRFSRFLEALESLYDFVEEQGQCCLEMSQDQFHPRYSRSWNLFRDQYGEPKVPFFNEKGRMNPITGVLKEGRAIKTHTWTIEAQEHEPWLIEHWNGEMHVRERYVYICSNGNVVSNCNMSFKRADAESKGNVNEKPLQEIIESFCTQEEENEVPCVSQ